MEKMIAVVGYSVFGFVMLSLVLPLIRAGAKKTAPVVGAFIYLGTTALFLMQIVLLHGQDPGLILTLAPEALIKLGVAALLLGFGCLCLFRSLAVEKVLRVAPLINLEIVFSVLAGAILFSETLTLFRVIYLVLILLGTVLMAGGEERYRDKLFFVFAIAAALFFTGVRTLITLADTGTSAYLSYYAVFLGASAVAFVFCLIGRSFRTLKNMTMESALFTLSAGVATGLAGLASYYVSLNGELLYRSAAMASLLPLTLFAARIFNKERSGGIHFFGMLLVLGGMLALTLLS